MKKLNLIGERFGTLIVIDRATVQDGKNYRWLCLCDCGNQCEVTTCHLRSGHTRSCGRCQTFIEEGEIVKCVLPDGGSFIFDKADLPLVRRYSWSIDNHGYVRSWCREYGFFKLHRLLTDIDSPELVDHINGIRSDNRRCNLRLATTTQNSQNSAMRHSNRTGYKGVTLHKSGKFHARINVNKKCISLGYFSDPLQAALAYNKAAIRYFGEYARLNTA